MSLNSVNMGIEEVPHVLDVYDVDLSVRNATSVLNNVPSVKDESFWTFPGNLENIRVSIPLSKAMQLRNQIFKIWDLLSVACIISEHNPFVFKCVRRCDFAMTTVFFSIGIFQVENADEMNLEFEYIDGSYQFFQKTFYMFYEIGLDDSSSIYINELQGSIFAKDLSVLHPFAVRLLHFSEDVSTSDESFSKLHPGITEPPSLKDVAWHWNCMKKYIQNNPIEGLCCATEKPLKGTPVPPDFIEFVMNSKISGNKHLLIELLGFLVAAICCDPIKKYENPDGTQYLLHIEPNTIGKICEVIVRTLSNGELCKRHALRFLYAAVVRLPAYTELFNDSIKTFLNDVVNGDSWNSNKMFSMEILKILGENNLL